MQSTAQGDSMIITAPIRYRKAKEPEGGSYYVVIPPFVARGLMLAKDDLVQLSILKLRKRHRDEPDTA